MFKENYRSKRKYYCRQT